MIILMIMILVLTKLIMIMITNNYNNNILNNTNNAENTERNDNNNNNNRPSNHDNRLLTIIIEMKRPKKMLYVQGVIVKCLSVKVSVFKNKISTGFVMCPFPSDTLPGRGPVSKGCDFR